MKAPLIRTRLDGRLYQRPEKVEALLEVLEALPRSDILARCTIRDRSHPDYVPSECLLYFVRVSRSDNSNDHFERLYKILTARVLVGVDVVHAECHHHLGKFIALDKSDTFGGVLHRLLCPI